jgi:hypothetical protein
MNKLMIFCLLLALAVPILAVDGRPGDVRGCTVPALPAGAVGRLDTTSEESLTFEYSGTKVLIPYSQIESFEYSTEVTRHLGVMPAIAVGLIKMHQLRYYFRISYRSADNVSQVVVFEVPKHMPRSSKPSSWFEPRRHAIREACVLPAQRRHRLPVATEEARRDGGARPGAKRGQTARTLNWT